MTTKYFCDYCHKEITDLDDLHKLVWVSPAIEDQVFGEYHGSCFDRILEWLKQKKQSAYSNVKGES